MGQALGTSHGVGDSTSAALPQKEGEGLSGKPTNNWVNNTIYVSNDDESGRALRDLECLP